MKLIRPFRGLRPTAELAARVASHPYDVVNREEAAELAAGNPVSFFHINKPEIDLPTSVNPYSPEVYQRGAENLQRFISEGVLVRDKHESFYVYQQIMGNHRQVGLVAVASVDAYDSGAIKIHEFTRPDKEDDRVNHMDALGAQVGPVFLTYHADPDIDALIASVVSEEPDYDFEAQDGTRHTFWVVRSKALTTGIDKAFQKVDCLYVADGHHRSAAAARVRDLYRKRNASHRGDESYNWFLVVVFPDNQMQILDYNRVVKDLNGLDENAFLARLTQSFEVEPVSGDKEPRPGKAREFGMYLDGRWYRLSAKPEITRSDDPVSSLDVSLLQDYILGPLLGITDPRRDYRVDFVGGIRGLKALEKRVDSGEWKAAFALYPTSISSLMAIADAGQVMPPKSTWFEPKLKSGLVLHVLD